jgi:predicted DNA-binding protein (MmcQ/YjbR family)
MNRRELIEYCLTYPDTYEDYPFDDTPDSNVAWTVMRHRMNKKSFAFIYERGGLCVNLKCEPLRADFLRQIYSGVIPAYHMNKEHWNTILLNSDVPDEELYSMIEHSYRLTMPKLRN